jgi:hypothetical protein
MQFVVVCICFQVINDLLPVCCEDISVCAMQTLIDLRNDVSIDPNSLRRVKLDLHWPKHLYRILERAQILDRRAVDR